MSAVNREELGSGRKTSVKCRRLLSAHRSPAGGLQNAEEGLFDAVRAKVEGDAVGAAR